MRGALRFSGMAASIWGAVASLLLRSAVGIMLRLGFALSARSSFPRKRDWWEGGEWEHGDLVFPPRLRGGFRSDRLSPAIARARPMFRRRVSVAVATLNQLVSSRAVLNSQFARCSLLARVRATNVQRRVVDSLRRRDDAHGEVEGDLVFVAAFGRFMSAKELYTFELQNIATYDISKLLFAKGDVVSNRAEILLPLEQAGYIRRFRSSIERPQSQIVALHQNNDLLEVYWDRTFAAQLDKKRELLFLLYRLGLLGVHLQVKQVFGVLFLKKKDGNIRSVVDARRTNVCHKRFPRVRFAAPISWRELGLDILREAMDGFWSCACC